MWHVCDGKFNVQLTLHGYTENTGNYLNVFNTLHSQKQHSMYDSQSILQALTIENCQAPGVNKNIYKFTNVSQIFHTKNILTTSSAMVPKTFNNKISPLHKMWL